MSIGQRLTQFRESFHITKEEYASLMGIDVSSIKRWKNKIGKVKFAKLIGVDASTLQRWENNENFPQTESIIKLMGLGLSIDWLFKEVGKMYIRKETHGTKPDNNYKRALGWITENYSSLEPNMKKHLADTVNIYQKEDKIEEDCRNAIAWISSNELEANLKEHFASTINYIYRNNQV